MRRFATIAGLVILLFICLPLASAYLVTMDTQAPPAGQAAQEDPDEVALDELLEVAPKAAGLLLVLTPVLIIVLKRVFHENPEHIRSRLLKRYNECRVSYTEVEITVQDILARAYQWLERDHRDLLPQLDACNAARETASGFVVALQADLTAARTYTELKAIEAQLRELEEALGQVLVTSEALVAMCDQLLQQSRPSAVRKKRLRRSRS